MDFKQLQSFISCVEYKSLSIASEKLGIAQPTISIHLKNLEEELGTKLIYRTSKSFEVTSKGKEFYVCAQNILKLRDDLISDWKNQKSNSIKLGVSTVQSNFILPEILLEYKKINENLHFAIEQKDSKQIISDVENGKFEIGLVGMSKESENLTFEEFYEDKLVLITPATEKFLAFKKQGSMVTESLLKEPIIIRETGSGSGKIASTILKDMGLGENQLQVVANMDNVESIKKLVIGGLGTSIMSENIVREYIETGKLLQFEFPTKFATRPLYIVYQKDHILNQSTMEFINFLTKFYK